MQKLAVSVAKDVLDAAAEKVAEEVLKNLVPALGALLTVAVLPHTYSKIHQASSAANQPD